MASIFSLVSMFCLSIFMLLSKQRIARYLAWLVGPVLFVAGLWLHPNGGYNEALEIAGWKFVMLLGLVYLTGAACVLLNSRQTAQAVLGNAVATTIMACATVWTIKATANFSSNESCLNVLGKIWDSPSFMPIFFIVIYWVVIGWDCNKNDNVYEDTVQRYFWIESVFMAEYGLFMSGAGFACSLMAHDNVTPIVLSAGIIFFALNFFGGLYIFINHIRKLGVMTICNWDNWDNPKWIPQIKFLRRYLWCSIRR